MLACPVELEDSHCLVIKIGETWSTHYSQRSQENQRHYRTCLKGRCGSSLNKGTECVKEVFWE